MRSAGKNQNTPDNILQFQYYLNQAAFMLLEVLCCIILYCMIGRSGRWRVAVKPGTSSTIMDPAHYIQT